MVGGRALISPPGYSTVWLRYRRRMGRAVSELDTLESLGVDDRWLQIVVVGVAADLLAGRDVPQERSEWVQSVLEAENIRIGSRMSIAGGLRQYRNMLMRDAMGEMKAEYRLRVAMNSPFGSM